MYATLRKLYLEGRLTDAGLDNAVSKKYITQAQADQIRADKAAADADKAALEQLVLDSVQG
jgi:hypothetical protein